MVTQLPEEADEHSVTMRQLLAKLDVAMGGRVAEELIFGASDVTTGASSDLEQVSSVLSFDNCLSSSGIRHQHIGKELALSPSKSMKVPLEIFFWQR